MNRLVKPFRKNQTKLEKKTVKIKVKITSIDWKKTSASSIASSYNVDIFAKGWRDERFAKNQSFSKHLAKGLIKLKSC